MSKVTELTKELQRVMYSTTYSFEIDTEDYVFGFKNTIKKRTKSLAKASGKSSVSCPLKPSDSAPLC